MKYYLWAEGVLASLYLYMMFTGDQSLIFTMLGVLLTYLCLKIGYYILHEFNWSVLFLIVALIGIIIARSWAAMAVIFFTPTLYQMFFRRWQQRAIVALVGTSLVLALPVEYQLIVVLGSVLAVIVLAGESYYTMRIRTMGARNDLLERKLERFRQDMVLMKKNDADARYQSQLEERNQIAQQLHDELGHTLSGSTMQLEAAKLVMQQDPKQATAMLDTVINGLRRGTESIRRILKNIKPEAATININNIQLLANETMDKCGIKVDVAYDQTIAELSREQWSVIALNIREALTNMMKYSGAKRCWIRFESLNTLFKISVTDDGQGSQQVHKGLGIQGMEERMIASGGQLIVDGEQGFTIIMLMPRNPS